MNLKLTPDWKWESTSWGGLGTSADFRSGTQTKEQFSPETFVKSIGGDHAFQQGLQPQERAELNSIVRERDPEVFYSSLLVFAQRLENRNRAELAAPVLAALAAVPPEQFSDSFVAKQRLATLRGQGPVCTEALLRGFTQSATDYRLLAPMFGATLLGAVAKTATASRLLAAPRASFLTRGVGLRLASGFTGFAAESLAFAGLGRALHASPRTWGEDILASTLSLGALKISGNLASSIRPGSQISRYAGMYLGMLGAHHFEASLNLRQKTDGMSAAVEALASLISLEAGAGLGRRFLGRKYAAFQTELELRSRQTQPLSSQPPDWLEKFPNQIPVVAESLGAGRPSLAHAAPVEARPLFMVPMQSSGGGKIGASVPMRFFAKPSGDVRGNRKFVTHYILPNLQEIVFEILVDAGRGMEVLKDNPAYLFSPAGTVLKELKVEKVPSYQGRFMVDFGEGRAPLAIELTASEERPGDANGFQVKLASQQPLYSAAPEFLFTSSTQKTMNVTLKAITFISDRGVQGNRGGIKKYHLLLSNGDVIELEVFADHKRNGSFKAHAASLQRFTEKSDQEPWLALRIRGEANGPGKLNISGEDYKLELPVVPPSGSRGAQLQFPSGLIIRQAPGIVVPETFASDLDTTRTGVFIPDAESTWALHHPRWDTSRVTIKFTGELGGFGMDPQAPLAIEGTFQDGRFVPDLPKGEEKRYLFRLKGYPTPLMARLRHLDDGIHLEVLDRDKEVMNAPLAQWGHQLGFSPDRPRLAKYQLEKFSGREFLTADKLPKEWTEASPEVLEEILPFLRRSQIGSGDGGGIEQGKDDASWIRVSLPQPMNIYFKRSKDTSGQVEYELYSDASDAGEYRALVLGEEAPTTLEGIGYSRNSERHVVALWQGNQRNTNQAPHLFKDAAMDMREIEWDATKGSLKLRVLKKYDSDIPIGGLLDSWESNGKAKMTFQLDNGHRLLVTLPKNLHFEEALLSLAIKPSDWEDEKLRQDLRFTVEERDVRGATIREGMIFADALEWILDWGKEKKAVYFDPFHSSETHVALSIQKPQPIMEDAPQLDTAVPVIAPPSSMEIQVPIPTASQDATTGAQPSKLPDRFSNRRISLVPREKELRFPWEEGAFVSPSAETRELMRRAALPDGNLKEGDQAQFRFYGEPYSPDMKQSSARIILSKMKDFGERSHYFYGWIAELPMIFQNGEWIPDSKGRLVVERRFPHYSSRDPETRRLLGNFRVGGVDGNFPILLSSIGTGWGLQVGKNHVLRPYRVMLEKGTQKFLSPDFSLSMGEPTDAAKAQLGTLEEKTFVKDISGDQLKSIQGPPNPPVQINAVFGGGFRGRVTPEFGDPVYRTHLTLKDREAILEFAPGYSKHYPEARFTQLRLYDGNGFNWRMIFQHLGDTFKVVGFVSNSREQRLDHLDLTNLGEGRMRISGILPPRYRVPGAGARNGFPFQIFWYREENDFALVQLGIDFQEYSVDGMVFNPDHWKVEDIFRAREGQDLLVRVGLIERNTDGHRPKGEGPPESRESNAFLPKQMEQLAQERVMTQSANDTIKVVFTIEDKAGDKHILKVPMRYNDRQRAYEPVYSMGSIHVNLDGKPIPVNCHPTSSGRNWRLTFPEDQHPWNIGVKKGKQQKFNAFLGNFYIHASDLGGRPAPMFWISTGTDPHRRLVNRLLEDWNLAPGVEATVRWKKSNLDEAFVTTLHARGQTFRVPFHIITLPNGKFMAFPTGAAERKEGEAWKPIAVNYYKSMRGSPAVVEWDGIAYEIEVQTRQGYPQLSLRRTHPGASGVYMEDRSRASVMLQPNDRSSLLLIDLNPEDFLEEIKAIVDSGKKDEITVKRLLWDGLSRETYEVLFRVEKDLVGRSRLSLLGIAKLTNNGPEVISKEALWAPNRLYVRTKDGHYLSMSYFPGHSLTISSHGKVLDANLLKGTWQAMQPPPSIFTQKPLHVEITDNRSLYFNDEASRREYRDHIADKLGLEGALLWDWNRDWPKGTTLWRKPWNALHPDQIIYQRGGLQVEVQKPRGILTIQNPEVTYHGKKIPSEIYEYEGRQHLVLGGPLSGVTFYWNHPVNGVYNLVELTHPAFREQLEKDAGNQPIPRQRFKKDKKGQQVDYPEVKDEIATALFNQVARSRLWRIQYLSVLPSDLELQTRLSRVLIPNANAYGKDQRPKILTTLEELGGNHAFRGDLKRILQAAGEGRIGEAELQTLVPVWEEYVGAGGSTREQERALKALIRTLHTLADRKAGS